ncbi:MAG: glycosyltransferase family 4 protein [Verrucomicrobia bacterium]|nr:glycosyltransferase family 4 protein [Verrucomicrobiota bacterium]
MKITMLHYHLKPGGVTTVIRNAQRALAGAHEVRVLADFGYDDDPRTFPRRAREYLSRLPRAGILHTHNAGLGKNPALTCAVKRLAETGRVTILNQVHDFPEENRPAQLRSLRQHAGWQAMCYYDLPNVRWATLTTADAEKLAARGIARGKIVVLPNPVDDQFFAQPCRLDARPIIAAYARVQGCQFDPRKPFLLSPMKVMTRKNNAEAVSLIAQMRGWQLVISLDTDSEYSAQLKRRVRREKLPVVIGVGKMFDNPLPLFHAAEAILTTSKQEGFGYAFLEGWLCGKLVVGRDIPDVTRDFTAAGMDLRHLYREPDPERLATFLARPPRKLIAHNHQVVMREYSLAAYARRYASLWT